MKIKSAFQGLASRLENIFTKQMQDESLPRADLLDQIDRSWSGKARNGPLHYQPGHHGISSRDSSFRGYQHTRPQHTQVLPTPITHVKSRSISRVSSEPCSISTMAQATAPRNTTPRKQQDSASSVHDNEAQVFSAPVDIYPSNNSHEPTAPVDVRQKNRLPSWNRRKQHAAATAAANKAASVKTKAAASAAAAKKGEDAQTSTVSTGSDNSRKPCLKQGGLSNALSREPSVRHGTAHYTSGGQRSVSRGPTPIRLSSGRGEFINSDEAIGSWAMRKVSFTQNGRSDSAHLDRRCTSPTASKSKATEHNTNTNTASSTSIDPDALAAALASLEGGSGHVQVSTGSLSPGIIIGDTDLANEWPIPSDLSLLEHRPAAPPPLAAATTCGDFSSSSEELHGGRSIVSDPATASEIHIAAGDLPRKARSLDAHQAVDEEEAAALALATATGDGDGTAEWNAKFLKRWRAVKQRARLQALGMRSIWKLNSPHGSSGENGGRRHHPPELLTNEMPDGPPELPLSPLSNATSGSIKETEFSMSLLGASVGTVLGSGSGSAGGGGGAGAAGIHKDPSLATMLRGEVAEVC